MNQETNADRVFAIAFLSALVTLYLVLRLFGAFYLPSEEPGWPRYIHVPKGASAEEIANKLVRSGVVRHRWFFLLAAKFLDGERDLKFGDYQLSTGMAPVAVVRRLTAGTHVMRRLTVPEGLTLAQIATRLERRGLAGKAEFMAAAQSEPLRDPLGVQNDTLEGFLFPDTYYISGEETPQDLVSMMVHRFEEVYRHESLGTSMLEDYDMFDIVTIASIIEKEAVLDSEKSRIAGVIYNRLRENMRLDCDVTVQYALNKFGRRLTYADLAYDSPYNSYLHKGLPPGPICNPGRHSLRAALHPENTEFFYFVSKNNGTHHFSKTLPEHNQAVRKYQLGP
jgi:UPF0755 protein